ncbi:hypothetical protein ACMYSQ_004893 [Aspergillus niger]
MTPLPGRAGDPRQLLSLRDESGGSNAPGILAAVGTLTGLSTLVLWLRCYVRGYLLRRFNAEEYIITVAWLCAVGVLVCFVLEAQHGVGRFSKDITDEDEQVLSKLVYYHSLIVMVGLSLVKISLAVFLRRFSSSLLSKALVGSIIFLVAFTIACGLTLILQCIPVAAAWDTSLRPHARCFDSDTYTAIGLWNSSKFEMTLPYICTTSLITPFHHLISYQPCHRCHLCNFANSPFHWDSGQLANQVLTNRSVESGISGLRRWNCQDRFTGQRT